MLETRLAQCVIGGCDRGSDARASIADELPIRTKSDKVASSATCYREENEETRKTEALNVDDIHEKGGDI